MRLRYFHQLLNAAFYAFYHHASVQVFSCVVYPTKLSKHLPSFRFTTLTHMHATRSSLTHILRVHCLPLPWHVCFYIVKGFHRTLIHIEVLTCSIDLSLAKHQHSTYLPKLIMKFLNVGVKSITDIAPDILNTYLLNSRSSFSLTF